jgi:hypothetical protein
VEARVLSECVGVPDGAFFRERFNEREQGSPDVAPVGLFAPLHLEETIPQQA